MYRKAFTVSIAISLVLHGALFVWLLNVRIAEPRMVVIPISLSLAPARTQPQPGAISSPHRMAPLTPLTRPAARPIEDQPQPTPAAEPPTGPPAPSTGTLSPAAQPSADHGGDGAVQPAGDASGAATDPGVAAQSGPPSGLVRAKLTNAGILKYPNRRGEEGIVEVVYHIERDGRVTNIVIKELSGFYLLDRAVLQYLRSLRFQPATRHGVPVRTEVADTYVFSLRPDTPGTVVHRTADDRWRVLD